MQASFSNRRKAVSFTPQSLIRTRSSSPGETFPLVIEPEVHSLDLVVWAAHNRAGIDSTSIDAEYLEVIGIRA